MIAIASFYNNRTLNTTILQKYYNYITKIKKQNQYLTSIKFYVNIHIVEFRSHITKIKKQNQYLTSVKFCANIHIVESVSGSNILFYNGAWGNNEVDKQGNGNNGCAVG